MTFKPSNIHQSNEDIEDDKPRILKFSDRSKYLSKSEQKQHLEEEMQNDVHDENHDNDDNINNSDNDNDNVIYSDSYENSQQNPESDADIGIFNDFEDSSYFDSFDNDIAIFTPSNQQNLEQENIQEILQDTNNPTTENTQYNNLPNQEQANSEALPENTNTLPLQPQLNPVIEVATETTHSDTEENIRQNDQNIEQNKPNKVDIKNENNAVINNNTQQSQTTNHKKQKYDYSKLDSLPLNYVISKFGKHTQEANKYTVIGNNTISINENKWYCPDFQFGQVGAISLAKFLYAIADELDFFEDGLKLGGKACAFLDKTYKNYYQEYQAEPPIITNHVKFSSKPAKNKIPDYRPSMDNPYSYIEYPYFALTKEEKQTHSIILDCLSFESVANILGAEKHPEVQNQYIFTRQNPDGSLSTVNVLVDEERYWTTPYGKREKMGYGTVSFANFYITFHNGKDYFAKDVSKEFYVEAKEFLCKNITPADILQPVFEAETIVVSKDDPLYVFKTPYSRLNAEEKKIYYETIHEYPLTVIASHLGATGQEDGQENKWKFNESFLNDNIHIEPVEKLWNSWNNSGVGGLGATSLLTYYLMSRDGLDYKDKDLQSNYKLKATKMIAKLIQNGDAEDLKIQLSQNGSTKKNDIFTLPYILPEKTSDVIEYLHTKRKLPRWTIQKQINAGYLFAGFPAHWKTPPQINTPEYMPNNLVWATFLTVNGQGADMRAIARSDSQAKILALGSNKALGGFLTRTEPDYDERTVCSFEASIDSLSYHAIYPGRTTQSCMGTQSQLAAKVAFETFQYHNTKHICCFDNDSAGITATVRYVEELKKLLINKGLEEQMLLKRETDPEFTIPQESLYAAFYTAYKTGRINYLELTLLDYEESIKNNTLFYFDIIDDKHAIQAQKMLQKVITEKHGANAWSQGLSSGQIKTLNILPDLKLIETDPDSAAEITLNRLLSSKNCYLRIPNLEQQTSNDDNTEEDQEKVKKSVILIKNFLEKFKEQSGDQWQKLLDKKSIIFNRISYFKDWNEYLGYKLEHDLEFKEMMDKREVEFDKYFSKKAIKVNPKMHI